MNHLDLFSGIGGFALAAQRVWGKEHNIVAFCEIDPFCQRVLKKHWPDTEIIDDIRKLTADSLRELQPQGGKQDKWQRTVNGIDILTGGFPCQPFSCAGQRKGTADNRHLWPEMLRVIRFTKPRWIIAENVRGLLSIAGGVVFKQVCTDLETCGYEVQPVVIPACAVNAPHRRDRVWVVADITRNTCGVGLERLSRRRTGEIATDRPEWDIPWLEVAARLCRVDDGLPAELDGLKLSKSKHREERLKSLGNSIVPQVAEQIMRAIQTAEKEGKI